MMTKVVSTRFSIAAYVPVKPEWTGLVGGPMNPTWKYESSTDIGAIIDRMADVLDSQNPDVNFHIMVDGCEVGPNDESYDFIMGKALERTMMEEELYEGYF
jgi:hypothetical protein